MSAARRRSADTDPGWGHLYARFFDVVRARPLSTSERNEVLAVLPTRLRGVFFEQSHADQRHGLESARHVLASPAGRPDLVLAALLHDVGKRHARLGVLARVIASLLIRTRLPLPARFRAYRDHGPVAAGELADLGVPEMVVVFARHHHGPRPRGFDPLAWELLVTADQPAKTRERTGAEISSGPS